MYILLKLTAKGVQCSFMAWCRSLIPIGIGHKINLQVRDFSSLVERLLYQPLKFSICSNLVYLQQKRVLVPQK